MIQSALIRQAALDAGFSLCGIARARPLSECEPFLDEWIRQGYESGLEYMRRNVRKRLDPSLLSEGAKTVVVCAVNYKNTAWDRTARPGIASYAYARDYHTTIKDMLSEVLARVQETYPAVNGRCFTDTAPILEKAWAVEAGLGWRGKNSLLVTPRYGSFVLLGEILLDAECEGYDASCLTADPEHSGEGCGNCTRCIDNCPTGAIRAPGIVDTGRCIARLTIERLPEGVTVAPDGLHGWIFGCDTCQSWCPRNARTPLSADPRFVPVIDPCETTLDFWQNLAEDEFDRIFGDTPLVRAGYAAVRSRMKTQ